MDELGKLANPYEEKYLLDLVDGYKFAEKSENETLRYLILEELIGALSPDYYDLGFETSEMDDEVELVEKFIEELDKKVA